MAAPAADTTTTTDEGMVITVVEGNEVRILDSLLATVNENARKGDPVAIDQAVKILDLRLQYKKHTNRNAALPEF